MNARQLKDKLRRDIRDEILAIDPDAEITDVAIVYWQDIDWRSHINGIYSAIDRRYVDTMSARTIKAMHQRIDALVSAYRADKENVLVDETDYRGLTIYLDREGEGAGAIQPQGGSPIALDEAFDAVYELLDVQARKIESMQQELNRFKVAAQQLALSLSEPG